MLTGELATIAAAVTRLADRPAWSPADGAVLAECEALHVLEQRVAALKLVALAELDERGLAREAGATSTVAWLRWRCRVSGGAAAATLRLARALRRHPATAHRLLRGDLNQEQAHAIVESLDTLPEDLPPVHAGPPGGAAEPGNRSDVVPRVEALLLEHAATLDPRGLRAAGRHALAVVAPDIADEAERRALERAEARARRARRLDLHDDAVGGTHIRGYLDREGAAILRTALDPLAAPRGTGDDRAAHQRRADALVELCRHAMSGGRLPAQGGQPTQLVVTTSYDTLTRALGVGHTDQGEALSPATVRRLACDAAILPAVLSGDGLVLDVGRARRLYTGAARRALAIRDQGCAFPGCDRDPTWTEAHHMRSWLDGGGTDINNGVLVCTIHHHLLHEPDGWRVRLGKDGLPEFIPPPWIDPHQRPQRNARRRIRAP